MVAERHVRLSLGAVGLGDGPVDEERQRSGLRRARARLPTITSQRELTALNKELESGRHRNQKRTEELLKLMQQLEEAEQLLLVAQETVS